MIASLVDGYVRYLTRKRLVLKPTSTLTYATLLSLKVISSKFANDHIREISPDPLWVVESITHVRARERVGRALLEEIVQYLTERLPADAPVKDVIPEVEVEAELMARGEGLLQVLQDVSLPFEIDGTNEASLELDLRLTELFLLLEDLSRKYDERYLKPFVVTCFETLSDYIDVLELRWDHVDPVRCQITVRGRRRPISKSLAQELMEMPRRGDSVFPITSVDVARWERKISREWGREFRFL